MCRVAWPGYSHAVQSGQIFFKQKYIPMPPAQRRVGWLVRWVVMCGDLARSRPRDHRQWWSCSGGAQAAAVSTQLSSVTQQVGRQNNPHTDVKQCNGAQYLLKVPTTHCAMHTCPWLSVTLWADASLKCIRGAQTQFTHTHSTVSQSQNRQQQ